MNLFLAHPTYDTKIDARQVAPIIDLAQRNPGLRRGVCSMSLLAYNFNTLYAAALNARRDGVTHFLMLHADVVPLGEDWLAPMARLMAQHDLFAVSAIVPIKDDSGDSSTARMKDDGQPVPTINRLKMPPDDTTIFSYRMDGEDVLLINTGLLLIDLTHPAAEDVCFSITDSIVTNEAGQRRAVCMPEDWALSIWMHRRGLRYAATSEVKVLHSGTRTWGPEAAGANQDHNL